MVIAKPVGFTGPQVTGDHDCVQFIHTLIGSELQFGCGVNMSNTQVNQSSHILFKVANHASVNVVVLSLFGSVRVSHNLDWVYLS